jgi:predicted Fe-Mo cluster-binding NifX family protein
MKIIVTASGETLDSPVDPRFGRAEAFILFDDETGDFEALNNSTNRDLAQGAGIQAAALASKVDAKCVITGHCGPKAFRALEAAGVEVFVGAKGTIREALDRFKAGELESASEPNAEGHW